MRRMTRATPLPFEVRKKALRPSGRRSFVSGKRPSIVLPSYSVHSSISYVQSGEVHQGRNAAGQVKQERCLKRCGQSEKRRHLLADHESLSFIVRVASMGGLRGQYSGGFWRESVAWLSDQFGEEGWGNAMRGWDRKDKARLGHPLGSGVLGRTPPSRLATTC